LRLFDFSFGDFESIVSGRATAELRGCRRYSTNGEPVIIVDDLFNNFTV
jgi:hypothetical protein